MTKILILLSVNILFFILLCFVLIMPQLEPLHFMRAKENKLKQNYLLTYRKIRQVTLLKQQLRKLNKINNKAEVYIFKQQSGVIHAVNEIAQQFNIQIKSIQFKDKYQFGQLSLCPILIGLTGGYENLQAFTFVLLKQFLLTGFRLSKKQNNYFGSYNLGFNFHEINWG